MNGKKKEELSDIAACLGLDDQGTISVLTKCIRMFLDANPVVRNSSWYIGLHFDSSSRSRRTKQSIAPEDSDEQATVQSTKRARNLGPQAGPSSAVENPASPSVVAPPLPFASPPHILLMPPVPNPHFMMPYQFPVLHAPQPFSSGTNSVMQSTTHQPYSFVPYHP